MTTQEAARLLSVSPTATAEKLEARYRELERKLQEQIERAPTLGLQARYRASLAEVTTAFETLVLASQSAELPGLLPQDTAGHPATADATPAPPAASTPTAPAASRRVCQRNLPGAGQKAFGRHGRKTSQSRLRVAILLIRFK